MLKSSTFLLRYSRCSFKPNQMRFLSTKQMLEEPGSGACCTASAEVCKSVAKKPEKKKKILGPPTHPNLKCIDNPCCPDPPTSYDEDFAHLLKHEKRTKFQTTWRECPPRRKVEKIVCGEPLPEPECEPVERQKSYTSPTEECIKQDKRCPKVTMPGCKPPPERTYCKQVPQPADCEKIKCPYPAYSECQRTLPSPLRAVECNCLRMGVMCEVYKIFKKLGKLQMIQKKK